MLNVKETNNEFFLFFVFFTLNKTINSTFWMSSEVPTVLGGGGGVAYFIIDRAIDQWEPSAKLRTSQES